MRSLRAIGIPAPIVLLLVALTFCGQAWAGPLEDANAALFLHQDYATALRLYRPLADKGDARAQKSLGVMYWAGQGVPQDYAEAVKWFRLAANQGDATAQYSLGYMYYNGQGVPQDYAEALKWYRLAADKGDANAQFNLGFMYGNGEGVPQDYVQAHIWFNLAASRSPASEKQQRDQAAKNRDTLAAMMTPAQIAEAQKFAREWKPKK
jgi:uncharacterized protein